MPRSHENGPPAGPDLTPRVIPIADTDPGQQIDTHPSSIDQATQARDVEILGKSYQVRIAIDAGVTKALGGIKQRVAGTKNKAGGALYLYRKARYESAKDKYERKDHKAAAAEELATLAEAQVGSGHFFSGKHHAKRLKAKAEKLRGKANDYQNGKFAERKKIYDNHSQLRQSRLDKVQEFRDKHEAIHNRKIENYALRKSLALSHKEIRKMKRQEHRGDISRAEASKILSRVSLEQRKRIGAAAAVTEVAVRDQRRTEKAKNHAKHERDAASDMLQETNRELKDAKHRYDRAAGDAAFCEQRCNDTRDNLQDLRRRREALDDQDGRDDEKVVIDSQIEMQETELKRRQESLDKLHRELVRANHQIESLTDRKEAQERKLHHLDSRYDSTLAAYQEDSAKVRELHDQQRRIREGILGQVPRAHSTDPGTSPVPPTQPPVTHHPMQAPVRGPLPTFGAPRPTPVIPSTRPPAPQPAQQPPDSPLQSFVDTI